MSIEHHVPKKWELYWKLEGRMGACISAARDLSKTLKSSLKKAQEKMRDGGDIKTISKAFWDEMDLIMEFHSRAGASDHPTREQVSNAFDKAVMQ